MKNGKVKKNEARYIPFVIQKRYTAIELIRKHLSKNNFQKERFPKDDEQ
jgi:predicted FMN-binding regulatory protein PaiB